MKRQDGRAYDELRPIKVTTDFVKFAEGSCLIECGDTKVLCCASSDPTFALCHMGRGAVFNAGSAPFIGAGIERGREELLQKPTVAGMDENHAEARSLGGGSGPGAAIAFYVQ